MFSPKPTTPLTSDFDWQHWSLSPPFGPDQPLQQVDLQPLDDSKTSGSQGTKRKHHDSERENLSQQTKSGSKRPKSNVQYSCPYRRRNPLLFNVRDFHTCANGSFSSITLVKRHVMSNHRSKDFTLQCLRCKAWFRKQAFECHSMNQSCSGFLPPIFDVYDKGITQDMEAKLRDRRAKTQVLTWEDFWRTIFPSDADIGTPDFEPILEHNEAKYRGLLDLDYNAMIQLRGVLFNSDALDPAEVVRKACQIVNTSSLQAQAFPPLPLEPCLANFQCPSSGPDMGLQNDLSNSRAPEDHP